MLVVNTPVSSTVYFAPSGTPEIVYVVPGTAVIVHTLPAFVPDVTSASIISVSKVTVIINAVTSEGIPSPELLITFLTLKLPVALEVLYIFSNAASLAVATVPPTTVTSTSLAEDAAVSRV